MTALHDDLRPVAFLLGTWRGEGHGEYPTIEPFAYGEELAFDDVGDAFLVYTQRSWDPADGAPLHLERGFLRPGAEGAWELALAHPLGLTEVAHGSIEGRALSFVTPEGGIGRTATGLDVVAMARRYRVEGDVLAYEIDMATDRTPMTRHLVATLRRVSG
ncbi:MAG: FABP family protein [Planctomycetaceae bacterium]